jgi:hypothetical protein
MPFPLVVALPAESERWSYPGCRLQVRLRLHTDISKECGCASKKTQYVVSSIVHQFCILAF